ncbi:MAG: choice-of-anchor L domain-containing protein, partial [Lentimicrobium sp.]|nr:choice-of-anchor L domain-containing protein [Lentimicrobium sp.]
MKTITQSIGARILVSLVFSFMLLVSAQAQFGTQGDIVPVRVPDPVMPKSGNSSQGGIMPMAVNGSISVGENSAYNAMTPSQLVQNVLVTGCLQASNVRFGYYNRTNNNAWVNHNWSSTPGNRMMGYFEKGTSSFPLEEGLILSTGRISSAMGPNNHSGYTDKMVSNASDPDLHTITNQTMYDAAVLEFDFVPAGNVVEFKYVFASEEYLEYVHTAFNDAFGFFLSGPGISGTYTNNAVNLAVLPNGEAVTINNIHPAGTNVDNQNYPAHNQEFYVNNPSGSTTMQFDGYTVVLTATYQVVPCQTYRIKMSIADAADDQWDAAVFLGARSFNSETLSLAHYGNNILDNNNIFEGCPNNRLVVTRQTTDLTNDYTVDLILSGSAVNGTDILTAGGQPFPTQITIPAGTASYEIPYYAVNDGAGDNAETFIVRVRNSCPCDENAVYVEEVINIYEQVTISALNATNVQCFGQNNGVITVNATGGSGNYEYSRNNGTSWQTSNTFTGLTSGNYTILVRDPGSCYEPVSGSVTVGAPSQIVANAGSDVAICSGTSTQLNGSGGVNYSWSPVTGLSNPAIANPVASPSATTTYTLTVSNASGICSSTDQVVVTVNPSPVVSVSPAEIEICRGTSTTLQASGAVSYVWNPTGATTSAITVSPNSNASYTVTGTASNGCTGSAVSTVLVKEAPANVNAGADANIGLCQTHQLQGSATGTGLSYQWSPSAGLSNPAIANPVYTPSAAGSVTFTLTVTGSNSCSASDDVTVNTAEVISATENIVAVTCAGGNNGSISLTIQGGTQPYNVAWTGPASYSASSAAISNLVSGSYAVVITDANGCSFTNSYLVGVLEDETNPTIVCPENINVTTATGSCSANITIVPATASDNCGTPAVTGQRNDGLLLNEAFPVGTTLITWTATDASGNFATCTQSVIVVAGPDAVNDDFSSSAINGQTGGNTASVLTNDYLNCQTLVSTDVNTTLVSNGGITGASISSTGIITIPSGTPAGTYTLVYQICEVLNPANCDQAEVSVTVSAASIDAVADNGSANGYTGGTAVSNVLTNDLLNGAAVNASEVILTQVSTTNAGISLSGSSVVVAAGTPAGTYILVYQICEVLNPTNCDQAEVSVIVDNAVIEAVNDDFTSNPLECNEGGVAGNVLVNDKLNNLPVDAADVVLSIVNNGGIAGLNLSETGVLTLPSTVLMGSYTVTYSICDAINPANCDVADVLITVTDSENPT